MEILNNLPSTITVVNDVHLCVCVCVCVCVCNGAMQSAMCVQRRLYHFWNQTPNVMLLLQCAEDPLCNRQVLYANEVCNLGSHLSLRYRLCRAYQYPSSGCIFCYSNVPALLKKCHQWLVHVRGLALLENSSAKAHWASNISQVVVWSTRSLLLKLNQTKHFSMATCMISLQCYKPRRCVPHLVVVSHLLIHCLCHNTTTLWTEDYHRCWVPMSQSVHPDIFSCPSATLNRHVP